MQYTSRNFLSTYTVCPTNVELQAGTSPTLSWDLPALSGYFGLTNFTAVWKESSESEAWTPLDDVDSHQKHFNINTSQFSSASGRYAYVAVQANYQGKCVTSKECRLDLRRGISNSFYLLHSIYTHAFVVNYICKLFE